MTLSIKDNFDAVILAAGLGSRLKNLTSKKPKAMIKFNNKEIILHQLDNIEKIIIVVGYKSKTLISFLKDRYDDLIFINNKDYKDTNSAYSFHCIKDYITKESYIHINCDILFSSDLLKKMIQSSYSNIIATRSDLNLLDKMECVSINKSNRIIMMSLNKQKNSSQKGFGLAKISKLAMNANIKKFYELKEKIRNKENYFGLIRRNLNYMPYYAMQSNKHDLSEINTIEDFEKCEFLLK